LSTLLSLFLSDMQHPLHTHLAFYTYDNVLLSQSRCPDTISCRPTNTVMTLLKYLNMQKL
jgi:hypothetical protein